MNTGKYLPIENYGIIGDLKTAALVGTNGSIDFMSFPRFDSPTLFARLLDHEKGGYFQITPIFEKIQTKQHYVPDTNILTTRFHVSDGVAEVEDFMPPTALYTSNILIRKVRSIKGKITFRMSCRPRFCYAEVPHSATQKSKTFLTFSTNDTALSLSSSHSMHLHNEDGLSEFTLESGEVAYFVLEESKTAKARSEKDLTSFVENLYTQTHDYWLAWTNKCSYDGRWRENVIRSALTLKLLISEDTGSIIAAPTFGLPEWIGGRKNWDYRYVWIRDASFVVYSFIQLGYKEEADAFVKWIMKILHERSTLHLMYSIDGHVDLKERTLPQFEGYMGSNPVLIGNAAYKQHQLDIYGEFMDALYLYDKHVNLLSHDEWKKVFHQIDWIAKHWREKSFGIWEIRSVQKDFLYTRVMCWVALDRAIKLATKRSFPFPECWSSERDALYKSVFKDFWSEKKQSFIAYIGTENIDASCLRLPFMRIISPKDPRWLSTLKRVEEELVIDGLVYRYMHPSPDEGTFSLCSFWYAECLSRAGQLEKAFVNFEKMLSFANHLGLYSEQLGLQGNHLGNFPQALSHLALISCASDLNKRIHQT